MAKTYNKRYAIGTTLLLLAITLLAVAALVWGFTSA